MSGRRHPDKETLANLRAGLVGGFRGRLLAAHVARCAHCAATGRQLDAVGSFLASVPAPALPESFERRITAALAAEAAARQIAADQIAADQGTQTPVATSPAAPRRRRPSLRLRPAMAFTLVVAFLLAGFGYLLSNVGGSVTSSGPEAASSASSSSSPAQQPVSGAAGGVHPAIERPGGFVVTASGIAYQAATLRAQVRGELAAHGGGGSATRAPGMSPAGTAASNPAGGVAGGYLPSKALVGCVLHLTRDVAPSLVDEATYQARPVYVIAVPGRAWVVGRGCTASRSALIATVALTAAP